MSVKPSSNNFKGFPDRFIPFRKSANSPGAGSLTLKPLPPPANLMEANRRKNISQTLLGCNDPYTVSVLFPSRAEAAFPPPLRLKTWEKFPITPTKVVDLPCLNNDYYSHPFAYSPKNRSIAMALENQVYRYNTKTCALESFHEYDEDISPSSIAFSPKGKQTAVGRSDGTINLFEDSRLLCSVDLQKNVKICSLAFLKEGDFLAGDYAGNLYRCRIQEGSLTTEKVLEKDFGIISIVLSPNGNYLAIGGDDDTISIHDAESMDLIDRFEMGAGIRGIAFDPNGGPRVAFGGGTADPRLLVRDFKTKKLLVNLNPANVQITEVLWPSENRIFTTHGDGSYKVIPIDPNNDGNTWIEESFPVSKGTSLTDRILFAVIEADGNRERLILGGVDGPNKAKLTFFPLPQKDLARKNRRSDFPEYYSTIR